MTRRDIDTVVVVSLYKQGVIPADIARMFNCSGAMIRGRLKRAGVYVKKPTPKKAEHGTRTMYVHHGCRCEACCRAEHEQYLKRPEAKARRRTFSKWGDAARAINQVKTVNRKVDSKRKSDAKRRFAISSRPRAHGGQIRWYEIAEQYNMKCAICGGYVDPNDRWINESGRHCFGRNYPTVDHIVAIKNGGTDTFDNVQLAHKHCNSKKGAWLGVSV